MPRISKGAGRGLMNGVKTLVLGLIAFTLYSQLSTQDLSSIRPFLLINTPILLLIVVTLSLINWSVEALKWQFLVRHVSQLSFRESLKGVLSGLTLSLLIPVGIGDNLGRLSYLKGSRVKGISLGYLGGFLQMMVTALFGAWGVFYVVAAGAPIDFDPILLAMALIAVGVLVAILVIRLGAGKWLTHYSRQLWSAIAQINGADLGVVIGLALARYLVFVLQLFVLFRATGLALPADVILAGITWIFLSKTVIPAFNFLSDLGVREFSALLFFGLYQVPVLEVIIPVTFLWLINIFLPSMLGMYYLAQVKLVPARSNPA